MVTTVTISRLAKLQEFHPEFQFATAQPKALTKHFFAKPYWKSMNISNRNWETSTLTRPVSLGGRGIPCLVPFSNWSMSFHWPIGLFRFFAFSNFSFFSKPCQIPHGSGALANCFAFDRSGSHRLRSCSCSFTSFHVVSCSRMLNVGRFHVVSMSILCLRRLWCLWDFSRMCKTSRFYELVHKHKDKRGRTRKTWFHHKNQRIWYSVPYVYIYIYLFTYVCTWDTVHIHAKVERHSKSSSPHFKDRQNWFSQVTLPQSQSGRTREKQIALPKESAQVAQVVFDPGNNM